MADIDFEEPAEVLFGFGGGDIDKVVGGDEAKGAAVGPFFGFGGGIRHAPDGLEKSGVADEVAERVEDECAFIVDVAAVGFARRFGAGGDGGGVANGATAALHCGEISVFAADLLDVEGVEEALEPFVDPHIPPVGVADKVGPPFVAEFMEQ